MSKELEAYDIVFNSFNNCTCQDGRFPIRSALDHIYKVLKRNEPMKVDLTTECDWFYKCPNCGGHNIMERSSYCSDCGQRLVWSDEK